MAGESITKEQAIEQYGAGLIEVAEQMGYDFSRTDENAKDPKQFVLNVRAISRSNAKGKQSLERRLNSMQRDLKKVNQQLGDVHKFYTQQTRGQLARLRSDLETQRQEAIEAQDTDKFNKIDKDLRELEKRHGLELDNPGQSNNNASSDNADPPEVLPEFEEWRDQQDWWESDPIARAHAEAFNNSLPDEKAISLTDRLKAIDNEMEFYFARRNGGGGKGNEAVEIDNKKKPAASDVEGGGGNAGRGGDTTTKVRYSDLPDEAQTTCKSFVAQGLGTQEDFLNSLTPEDIADWNRGR